MFFFFYSAGKYEEMPLEEKRKKYKCGGKFVELKNIPPWPQYAADNDLPKPATMKPKNYTGMLRILNFGILC